MFFTSFKPTISAFTTSTFIAAEKKAIAQCLDWMTVSEVEGHLRREQRCRVPTTEVWYTHYMWHTWFDCRRMSVDHGASTAPKCHGDPILSKMGTQWGPNFESDGDLIGTFSSRNRDPKSVFLKVDRNELISWNTEEIFRNIQVQISISLTNWHDIHSN